MLLQRRLPPAVPSGKARFWEMHDKLFENPKALAEENLQSYASELNLDMEAFNQCRNEEKLPKQVRSDMATASRVGARGGHLISGSVCGMQKTRAKPNSFAI